MSTLSTIKFVNIQFGQVTKTKSSRTKQGDYDGVRLKKVLANGTKTKKKRSVAISFHFWKFRYNKNVISGVFFNQYLLLTFFVAVTADKVFRQKSFQKLFQNQNISYQKLKNLALK